MWNYFLKVSKNHWADIFLGFPWVSYDSVVNLPIYLNSSERQQESELTGVVYFLFSVFNQRKMHVLNDK